MFLLVVARDIDFCVRGGLGGAGPRGI